MRMKMILTCLLFLGFLPLGTTQEAALSQVEPSPTPQAGDREASAAPQAILAAKTVAVMGAWGEWEKPGTFGKIVMLLGDVSVRMEDAREGRNPGGGRRSQRIYEADPPTAARKVEDTLRKWGRFTVVDDPGKSDLVLLVVVRHHSKFGITLVSNELLVFPAGGVPNQNSRLLWQSGDTKAASGFAATKVTKKFQKHVEELEKKSGGG
jgi:hypothetical protein